MSDIRRTYFTMPGTFEPNNPTKFGFVVSSIKIDQVETLTGQYYQDVNPNGYNSVEYARCVELPNGTQYCSQDTPINTYNPFLGIPLNWPSVNLYNRGKVIDTVGGADYGLGILQFGVPTVNAFYSANYPQTTDVQEAKGSFFIDIDYDKSFSFTIEVYEYQVFKFSYNARFNKDDATFSYSRLVNGTYVPTDKYGFLSGVESNPYITPPQPTPDVCPYAIRTLGYAVPIVLPTIDEDTSDGCCKPLYVLASTTDNSRVYNDFTSDYYYKNLDADTVSFILKNVDNGNQVVLDYNNTYGSFYGFGDTAQENLSGVIVEWREVLLDPESINGVPFFGPGNYQINKSIQTAGTTINVPGTIFALKEYNPIWADRTVRITTIQNGDLIHKGVSFKGVQWPSSIRVPGYFGQRDPEYTQDNVVYGDYQSRQIRMTQTNKYQFKTEDIKDCVFREIMDFMLFANEIYITDYNQENHSVYRNVAVELDSNDGTEYLLKKSLMINLVFTDRMKNRFKSNFGLTQIAGSKFLEGQIGAPPVIQEPSVDTTIIKGFFTVAGEDDMPPIIIDNDTEGTYTSLLFDAGSGTVTLTVNGNPVTLPITLIPGDILDANRSNDTNVGWYKIST